MDLKLHNLQDPTEKEIAFINNFSADFVKSIKTNPSQAEDMFKRIIRPYMMAQLKTISMLDDQIEGTIEQNALMMRSNAVLIDHCKQHGVAMPNFDEIARDVRAVLQKESDLGIKRT